MNLLCDESVDGPIVERLRRGGHHVWYIAEMEPGLTDDEVLNIASEQKALLVTADKDFGEMVFRLRRFTGGIVLVRLEGLSADRKAEATAAAVDRHAAELADSFTVVSPGLCRIRPLTD